MSLRLATEEDKDELLRWRNDPITRYYRDEPRVLNNEEHLEWFNKNKDNIYVYEDSGVIKGQIKLDGEGEIGWITNPEYRNQGIGKLMLMEAIGHLSLAKAWCKIREDNIASIKLAESCGFVFDRQEGNKRYYALQK